MTKISLITTESSAGQYTGTLLIDHMTVNDKLYSLTQDRNLLMLTLSWNKKLHSPQETDYLQTLLKQKGNGNIPLLICPDDLDFDCSVVVIKISYHSDHVIWHKIGYVKGENYSFDKKKTTGYMDYATWADSDFEQYSEDYFFKKDKDIQWEKLWSLVWPEEERRRIWNYDHPYFNDDNNIDWLSELNWTFDSEKYDEVLRALIDLADRDVL